MVSQGSTGDGVGDGKKGHKKKPKEEGGTFRHLFGTREEPDAHLRVALEEGDNGDDRDDEGDQGDDKGEGGDKGGEVGGDKGAEKEGDMGGEKGGVRSKDAPRQPPTPQEG